jgi:hypothetical protein
MVRKRNEIPHELLPERIRGVEPSNFAFHDKVMLISYASKKNRPVIGLSTKIPQ